MDILVTADDEEITKVNREEAIKAALERYSADRPDEHTDDVTGDGGKYYGITANLGNWVEDFSRIVKIEYPAATIASDETPQYLDEGDWDDNYWASDTRYLFLPNHSPGATETMRITYTVPYTLSSGSVSTPAQDFYAICFAAACIYCQQVAAKYARISDSLINADSTSHNDKSDRFAQRAREFCATYEQMMGIGKGITGTEAAGEQQAAGTFVDWDTAPGWPTGRRYVFHGKNTR